LSSIGPKRFWNASSGTTAFAIARWPPADPISTKYFRTKSPAFLV
jgi:hypothetical protein